MTLVGDHFLLALVLLPLLGASAAGVAPRAALRWLGHGVAAIELLAVVLANVLAALGANLRAVEVTWLPGSVEVVVGLRSDLPGNGLSLLCGVMLPAWIVLGWQHRSPRRREVALPMLATSAALLVVLGSSAVTVLVGAILSSMVCVVAFKASRETNSAALLGGAHAVAAAVLLVVVASGLRGGVVVPAATQVPLIVLATLLRLGFPPLHGAWAAAAGSGDAMTRSLVTVSGAVTSGAMLLRLLPTDTALSAGWMLAGAVAAGYGGLVAMGAGSIRHVAVGLHVAGAALLLCSVAGGDALATSLLTVALATGPTSVLLLGRYIERRVGSDQLASLGGLSASMQAALLLTLAAAGVAAWLPLTAGFVGMLLVLSRSAGPAAMGWSSAALTAMSFVLLTCAATRLVRRVFFGPREAEPSFPSDLRWWEAAAVTMLVLLGIVFGMAPGLLGVA